MISVDQQKVSLGLEQRVFFARGTMNSNSISVTKTFDKSVEQCITETALVKVRERGKRGREREEGREGERERERGREREGER